MSYAPRCGGIAGADISHCQPTAPCPTTCNPLSGLDTLVELSLMLHSCYVDFPRNSPYASLPYRHFPRGGAGRAPRAVVPAGPRAALHWGAHQQRPQNIQVQVRGHMAACHTCVQGQELKGCGRGFTVVPGWLACTALRYYMPHSSALTAVMSAPVPTRAICYAPILLPS